MNTLVALALATPIWGFALQPPTAVPSVVPEHVAQIEASLDAHDVEIARTSRFDPEGHNLTMMQWTRALQVSTTVTMAITGALGIIQFRDEYGFHDEYPETACARGQGEAVFDDFCGESTPWPHLIAAGASASGLISSVALSTQVSFDRASRRDGDWRTYETTRWIALALGVLQAGAGAFLANAQRADVLTYEDDFDLMQGFAIAHMALGVANVGMNLYNSILLF